MRALLIALACVAVMGLASASNAEPVQLTAGQMDVVTAGWGYSGYGGYGKRRLSSARASGLVVTYASVDSDTCDSCGGIEATTLGIAAGKASAAGRDPVASSDQFAVSGLIFAGRFVVFGSIAYSSNYAAGND